MKTAPRRDEMTPGTYAYEMHPDSIAERYKRHNDDFVVLKLADYNALLLELTQLRQKVEKEEKCPRSA